MEKEDEVVSYNFMEAKRYAKERGKQ